MGGESKRELRSIVMPPDDAGMDDESGPLLQRLHDDEAHLEEMLRVTGAGTPEGSIHVIYEDHVEQDPRVGYEMICRHVGVNPGSIPPRLKKGNPFPISSMLENYDEVAAILAGTKFEWMLSA